MTKQNKFTSNTNLNFIQLKLFDFSEEKIDYEKIISERLNKSPNIENTNQKLFLDENNIFSYVNPICPDKNHKETIDNEEFEYSGYYLYDEQFLRLNEVRHYRLTLFNVILNVPVSELIVRRRILKNTKKY